MPCIFTPLLKLLSSYNVSQLRASGKPIATIKTVDTGPNASKAPADDANGLEAVTCLCDAHQQSLDRCWFGERGNGNYPSNLLT